MIDGILSSDVFQIMEKSLNAAAMQQKMISNNIANVDTPGYKRSEVVFQTKLDQLLNNRGKTIFPLSVTNKMHIPAVETFTLDKVSPEIVMNTETSLRTDGNNVDIDSEMSKMAENTAYYGTIAQLVSLKLGMLQSAINDGRR